MTEKKKKTTKPKKNDLELRVSQLEDLVTRLISTAHMCRNCRRYEKGICGENGRPTMEFSECNYFTRV